MRRRTSRIMPPADHLTSQMMTAAQHDIAHSVTGTYLRLLGI